MVALVHKHEREFWELLIEISEAAEALIEESECWVTNERIGCGECMWCRLASLTDRKREEPDS